MVAFPDPGQVFAPENLLMLSSISICAKIQILFRTSITSGILWKSFPAAPSQENSPNYACWACTYDKGEVVQAFQPVRIWVEACGVAGGDACPTSGFGFQFSIFWLLGDS
jgi:hypothetical protein